MLLSLRSLLRSHAELQIEIVALRHQLNVLQRTVRRPKLRSADRWLWIVLARLWRNWRSAVVIVKPETVINWHRQGFRLFWAWKSRARSGRPTISAEIKQLIRTMNEANPTWGAPRIHGELLKLGIKISEATVSRYIRRKIKPPSQTWRAFLDNHVGQLVSVDFFVVPTVWFQILFGFIVLKHDRRQVVHFNVTAHPTAAWTAQQIVEAFPFDTAPRFLLRDRDGVYGNLFRDQIAVMNIEEVLSAPRSPWQNAYAERLIGSIRRDCLDHIIVFDEGSLKRLLRSYFDYYHQSRTHLSLEKDSPTRRPVMHGPGRVISLPVLGGLHHRYERAA